MAFLSFVDFGDDDNDRESDGDGTGDDQPQDVSDLILVDNGTDHTGDDGQQVYLFDPEVSGGISVSIDAGAGDDIIDLNRLFDGTGLVGGQVSGGDGADVIAVEGEQNTISGGGGDDTITADLFASNVGGDAGDDAIRVVSGASDASFVDGGAGNDTIDGSGSENIVLSGGEGDDLIMTDGSTSVGTGYVIAADGGDGADRLIHEADVFPLPLQDPFFAGAQLTGGDGADSFEIRLTSDNGVFSPSDSDPEVFENDAAVITDFEQGTDLLAIDLSNFAAGYSAAAGTLSEDTEAGISEIVLRLTGDTLPDQDVRITVASTGLSWTDISFIGTPPATLLPAAA